MGVLAFDNEVQLPVSSDGCYSRQLALATKTNKKILTDFVHELPPDSTDRAVYSSAFQRAFELFAATSNSTESTTRKKGKKAKLYLARPPDVCRKTYFGAVLFLHQALIS